MSITYHDILCGSAYLFITQMEYPHLRQPSDNASRRAHRLKIIVPVFIIRINTDMPKITDRLFRLSRLSCSRINTQNFYDPYPNRKKKGAFAPSAYSYSSVSVFNAQYFTSADIRNGVLFQVRKEISLHNISPSKGSAQGNCRIRPLSRRGYPHRKRL